MLMNKLNQRLNEIVNDNSYLTLVALSINYYN